MRSHLASTSLRAHHHVLQISSPTQLGAWQQQLIRYFLSYSLLVDQALAKSCLMPGILNHQPQTPPWHRAARPVALSDLYRGGADLAKPKHLVHASVTHPSSPSNNPLLLAVAHSPHHHTTDRRWLPRGWKVSLYLGHICDTTWQDQRWCHRQCCH